MIKSNNYFYFLKYHFLLLYRYYQYLFLNIIFLTSKMR